MKVQTINILIREAIEEQTFFRDFYYGWRSDVNTPTDAQLFPRVFLPASPDGTVDYKSKSLEMNVRLIFEDLQGIDMAGAEVDKTFEEYWDDLLNNGAAFIQDLNTKLKQNGMGVVSTNQIRFDTNSNVANTRLIIAFFDFSIFAKLDCI